MDYEATVPVDFPYPPQAVFNLMSDLSRYPDWGHGVVSCSSTDRMTAGLHFTTETMVLGKLNRAEITVRELIPRSLIVLESNTGLVSFVAAYNISETDAGHCRVVCHARFSYFKDGNLTRPVREALADARIRGDLETMRSLLSG